MEADLSKEERKTGSVERLTMMTVADWCKEQQRCKKDEKQWFTMA